MDRLYGEYSYSYEDMEKKKGMDWVVKYLRMKHVIVFLMSHGAIQARPFSQPLLSLLMSVFYRSSTSTTIRRSSCPRTGSL
jgi:hypothetical protein